MTLNEAIELLRPAMPVHSGTWADIGAGTGLFSLALMEILNEGKVIAVDKSPHALYQLKPSGKISFEIVEADFHSQLPIPSVDGILMANSLHFAVKQPHQDGHRKVLQNVLHTLRSGGFFILIEYDTITPNPPWNPNPVSFNQFEELCLSVGLKKPVISGRRNSLYGDNEIYLAMTTKV